MTDNEPLIHQPDVKDDDPRNGLMCFLNADRECGADCMAYTTMPADTPQLNGQQKHCSLLVSVERLGKHSVIIAKLFNDSVVAQKKALADQQRAASIGEVPTPR